MLTRIAILCLAVTPLLWGCSSDESAVGQAVTPLAGEGQERELGPGAVQAKLGGPLSQQTANTVDDPVSGIVLGPRGEPRIGAQVTLFRRLRQWPRRDRTEIDTVRAGKGGRFVFNTSRGRDLEVEASARGCGTLVRPVPLLSHGLLVLHLRQGFRVDGAAYLPTGRPARECAVFLEPGAGSQMRAVATRTDREGRFEFRGVPADNLRLTARHPDYQPVSSESVTIGRSNTLRFEEAELGLSGAVTFGEKPVAGCDVLVYPRTTNGVLYVPFKSTTSRDGSYRIRGLGQGSYNIELRHADYSSIQRPLSLSESRTGLDLELQTKIRVRGRLVGVKKFEESSLRLVSFYGETGSADVSADGSFEFPTGFSRGMATFELTSGPYSFQASQSRWLGRGLNEQKHLELAVQSASVLEGTVLGVDGKPLAGVQVLAPMKLNEAPWSFLGDPSLLAMRQEVLAVTDQNGVYTIRGLEPGEVSLEFQKDQFACVTRVAKVGAELPRVTKKLERVNLQLPGSISGRVTRGRRPVSGALVSVGRGFSRAFTGPDGRFTLRGLPEGQHLVRVKFRTLPIAHSDKQIDVAPGQDVGGVDIQLPVGRRITGRVVDPEEVPMANMIVECQAGTTTKTDESGRFALDVPMGRTMLHVRAQPLDPISDRVSLDREETDVLIRLRQAPRAGLKIRVLALPRETPVNGMILRLDHDLKKLELNAVSPTQSWNEALRVMMDLQKLNKHHQRGQVERWIEAPEGVVDVSDLPAGTYTLTLHARGLQPFVKRLTLRDGKRLDLGAVRLEKGFSVQGLVVDRRGKPVAGAHVVLGRESDLMIAGARTRYVTDSRGRFTVEGVGLNLRDLYVRAKGFATQHHRLDLEADILRGTDDPVRVQMQPGATVKAILVGLDGERVPFKTVLLFRGFQKVGEAETDDQGIAWFQNVSRGTYHLQLPRRIRSLTLQSVRDTSGAKVYTVKMKYVRGRRMGRKR